jgi:hypothetical protein
VVSQHEAIRAWRFYVTSDRQHSTYFEGEIGETIPASSFPASNYVIDDSLYDYEGNWAFCVFDSDDVYAARFGFGRGMIDLSDYGSTERIDKDFLMLHIELMTRDGAVLWIGTGKFKAGEVVIKPGEFDHALVSEGREIFCIAGWPESRWNMQSDDAEVEVDAHLAIVNTTILPDCVMPNNLFAMWVAVCRIDGSVRFREKVVPIKGTAFFDHPRINVRRNAVPQFGWYLYTPTRFSDGSCLISYYTEDAVGSRVDYYSFGLYIDATGESHWLRGTSMQSLTFDSDGKPESWITSWHSEEIDISCRSTVRGTSILKAWGGGSVPQTRKDNGNIPLVFEADAIVRMDEVETAVHGRGIAEYLAHPDCAGWASPVRSQSRFSTV